jgi:CelD/BcsL family acetyltransferase involved in cellulose biosynthesis
MGADRLGAIAADWDDLSRRSAEPNAFYGRGFAMAAITLLGDAKGYEAAAIWRPTRDGDRLIGLFPFRLKRGPIVEALVHNYGPLGTPLLDAAEGVAACEAFFDWVGRRALGGRLLFMPLLPQEGTAAAMLRSAMVRSGLRHAVLDPTERAVAERKNGARYSAGALGARKAKDLARQKRRLEKLGAISLTIATSRDDVGAALDAFLALEESGWKGRAGTASTQRADRLAFVRAAVEAMTEKGTCRIYVMALDGRAIAAGLVLIDGPRAWYWKIAYDETMARFSPGVQLSVELTDDLLADREIRLIDSLADTSHPMVGHLWRETMTVADWLIDLTPGGSMLLPVAVRAERARRLLRKTLRAAVLTLRRTRIKRI